jgi:hypothetical protein
MPDNRQTRDRVAKANRELARAKEKEQEDGTPVPMAIRIELNKAIQAWQAK